MEVNITGHCYPGEAGGSPPCSAPVGRLHIRHDGEVGFCTDYFGFSIGNATEHLLSELIANDRAALWREAVSQNALPICNHCAWRLQQIG